MWILLEISENCTQILLQKKHYNCFCTVYLSGSPFWNYQNNIFIHTLYTIYKACANTVRIINYFCKHILKHLYVNNNWLESKPSHLVKWNPTCIIFQSFKMFVTMFSLLIYVMLLFSLLNCKFHESRDFVFFTTIIPSSPSITQCRINIKCLLN